MGNKVLTVALMAMLAAALLVSCADVPSTGPTPPVFNSEFRFVNAAADVSGAVSVSVDDASVGSLELGNATGYGTFPSGNRVVDLSTGDSQSIGMDSDQKASVYILPSVAGVRELVRLGEGRIFDNPREPSLRIFSAHPDSSFEVYAYAGGDTVYDGTALTFKTNTGYLGVAAATYTVDVRFAGGSATVASTSVAVASGHTVVVIGTGANASLTALND